MPLYEYRCQKCEGTIEVIQKMSDSPLTLCTTCGGELERLLSAPAIRFKGSGWYVTDYGRKNGIETSPSDKDGKGPGESSSKTSSEASSASETSSTSQSDNAK